MERRDGAAKQRSSRLAAPGRERKAWAEPAPWSKALLPLVIPASKDLAGVGGITPSPGLVSPVLTSALGFVTPSLFPVNSKKRKSKCKIHPPNKACRRNELEKGRAVLWRGNGVGKRAKETRRLQRNAGVCIFCVSGDRPRTQQGAGSCRKVGRGQISTYIGDLPGPSLLPLVLQLQLTAHCSKCVALGQQGDSPNFPGSLIPLCL